MKPVTVKGLYESYKQHRMNHPHQASVEYREVDASAVPEDSDRVSSTTVPPGKVWMGNNGIFYFGIAA